eukprot:13774480-Ditylum_brightwellii.AAC.1
MQQIRRQGVCQGTSASTNQEAVWKVTRIVGLAPERKRHGQTTEVRFGNGRRRPCDPTACLRRVGVCTAGVVTVGSSDGGNFHG